MREKVSAGCREWLTNLEGLACRLVCLKVFALAVLAAVPAIVMVAGVSLPDELFIAGRMNLPSMQARGASQQVAVDLEAGRAAASSLA